MIDPHTHLLIAVGLVIYSILLTGIMIVISCSKPKINKEKND